MSKNNLIAVQSQSLKDEKCFFSSAVQPVLYKAVFHGGLKSMWSSVMEVMSTDYLLSEL